MPAINHDHLCSSKKGTPVGMLRKVPLPDGTELTGGA